jgi:hypothetical protein
MFNGIHNDVISTSAMLSAVDFLLKASICNVYLFSVHFFSPKFCILCKFMMSRIQERARHTSSTWNPWQSSTAGAVEVSVVDDHQRQRHRILPFPALKVSKTDTCNLNPYSSPKPSSKIKPSSFHTHASRHHLALQLPFPNFPLSCAQQTI